MTDENLNFNIQISLEPVKNILYSMLLIEKSRVLSGINHWPIDTFNSLSREEGIRHRLIFNGFYFTIMPTRSWTSFPDYLKHLENKDPNAIIDKLLRSYLKKANPLPDCIKKFLTEDEDINRDLILESEASYLTFLNCLNETPANCCCEVDIELEKEAYSLMKTPLAMRNTIVKHLQMVWDIYLAKEWTDVKGIGLDSVNSFNHIDFSNKDIFEVIKLITDKDCRVIFKNYTLNRMKTIKRFIFVPSPHVGPYVNKFFQGDSMWIFFGARVPSGSNFEAPWLDHQGIITNLGALADSTRLKIVKHIATIGERSSVEIIQDLNLSQSAASRHLKQLSATGLLIERRGMGGKFYSINVDRINATFESVKNYLIPDS